MLALTSSAGVARSAAWSPAARPAGGCVRAAPRPACPSARPAAAVAVAAAPSSSSAEADLMAPAPIPVKGEKVHWYAVVANADFMLHDVQNEAFPEQLRERVRLFKDNGRPLDFFLSCEPAWLESVPGKEKVKRPAVALVSTDQVWITFMKLRLDRVLKVDVGELTPAEAIKSTQPVPAFAPLDRAAAAWTAPYSPYKPGWWEAFMADDV